MSTTLNFATQIAAEVGDYLIKNFNSSQLHSHLKSDRSLVTEADLTADRMIRAAINEKFPTDELLSEELHPDFISDQGRSIWIIDPLDGTTNYSLGLRIWGVLLTRLENGHPSITVMYFPLLDEMYTAIEKGGAYLNGKRIYTSQPHDELPLSFFACCSRTFRQYEVSIPYKVRILGSAAYSFCLMARGAAILAFEATPKIWDIAGAWLLVKEAGGVIATWDGHKPFPLQTNVDYTNKSFPTLAAKSRARWEKAKMQINRK
jgi:myo-inositol-1(or 4)-monophosphatase